MTQSPTDLVVCLFFVCLYVIYVSAFFLAGQLTCLSIGTVNFLLACLSAPSCIFVCSLYILPSLFVEIFSIHFYFVFMMYMLVVMFSDYAIQLENQHDSYVFGLANSELWKCVWELALACIFKGIITIFTFGIKVQ